MPEEFDLLVASVRFRGDGLDTVGRSLQRVRKFGQQTFDSLGRVAAQARRLGSSTTTATTALKTEERELNDVAAAADRAAAAESRLAGRVQTLTQQLNANNSVFNASTGARNARFQSGSGGAGGLTGALPAGGAGALATGLAAGAGAIAITKLLSVTKQAAVEGSQLARSYEQAQITLESFTGSAKATTNLLGQLQSFGAKTDFNFLEDLVPSTQALLAAEVTDAEGVIPLLRTLGDVKSGATNANLGQIIANLAQIKNTGRASLQDIRQFGNQGIPIFAELAKVTGASGEELGKLISDGGIGLPQVLAAFESLTGEGGRFFNLLEERSNSTQGQFSNLGDQLDELKRRLGTVINVPAGEVAGTTAAALGGAFADFDIATEKVEGLSGALLKLSPALIATKAFFAGFIPESTVSNATSLEERLAEIEKLTNGGFLSSLGNDIRSVFNGGNSTALEDEASQIRQSQVLVEAAEKRVADAEAKRLKVIRDQATVEATRTAEFDRQKAILDKINGDSLSADERKLKSLEAQLKLVESTNRFDDGSGEDSFGLGAEQQQARDAIQSQIDAIRNKDAIEREKAAKKEADARRKRSEDQFRRDVDNARKLSFTGDENKIRELEQSLALARRINDRALVGRLLQRRAEEIQRQRDADRPDRGPQIASTSSTSIGSSGFFSALSKINLNSGLERRFTEQNRIIERSNAATTAAVNAQTAQLATLLQQSQTTNIQFSGDCNGNVI